MTTTKKIEGYAVNTSAIGPSHTHSYPFPSGVSLFLQAVLPPFLHFVFWKTNTVKGNSNAVRPQFVSAESVGLWRNKWEISAPQPWLRREKHSLAWNAAYIQHRWCCFSMWKANQQNTFSFSALKWCRYLLCSMSLRHALFASRIQDKKQRANPDVTQP